MDAPQATSIVRKVVHGIIFLSGKCFFMNPSDIVDTWDPVSNNAVHE
jgi:hypothetical protein